MFRRPAFRNAHAFRFSFCSSLRRACVDCRPLLLVFGLGCESLHKLSMAQRAFQCSARQIVLVLCHCQLGLAAPIRSLVARALPASSPADADRQWRSRLASSPATTGSPCRERSASTSARDLPPSPPGSFKFARKHVLTLSSNDIRSSFKPSAAAFLPCEAGSALQKCILLLLCRLARRRIRRLLECRHVPSSFPR